ncbi:hypothetical protein KY317_01095 [Candidatus Woesearchaeota archaeon]|nr:hypothetical protein [Candidatus Woesearchaeota archaeon]
MFKKLLTEPKEHNPDDFIYLVHGLLDWTGNGISPQDMKDKLNKVRDPNQFYRASMIAHLHRESAKQRINWHGGEVYQMGTFGRIGVILDPAYDGLVQISWNCDLGSPLDSKGLARFVQTHKGRKRYPLVLLTQTRGYDSIKYNELILKGDNETSIKGIFFKPVDSKTEYEGKQLGEIVSGIMQADVPVIELPAPQIEKYDDIKDPEKRELMKKCKNLQAQTESTQIYLEFYQPGLSGSILL